MTALVRSELLKVRTTRSWWGYLLAVVGLAALAAAASIGSAEEERGDPAWQADLAEGAAVAVVIAMILGITAVTSEFRHGTITPSLLATPVRERLLAAKTIAVALLAVMFAVLALAAIAAVALIWLPLVDVELHFTSELAEVAGEAVLVTLLWALLGVAIGAAVHGQVAAIVGTLVWIFIVENLAVGLLHLLDIEGVEPYLPFHALDAADGTSADNLLSYGAGIAVSLAYIAAIGAFGVIRTGRRDIT